jgi:hypothetical protein
MDSSDQSLIPDETVERLSPKLARTYQLEMFRDFVGDKNITSKFSNLFMIWDRLPKYSISKKYQQILSKENKFEKIIINNEIDGTKYQTEIEPARIEIDGKYKNIYPSDFEFTLELLLRKMLTEQDRGVQLKIGNSYQTWARFSLNDIRKRLKALGKTRSNLEVRIGLEILCKAKYCIKRNGRKIHTGSIIMDWIEPQNEKYTVNQDDSLQAIMFSNLVSASIASLEFIQYNHDIATRLSSLAKWLFIELSISFTGAEAKIQNTYNGNKYKISQAEIENGSCLLKHIIKTSSKRNKVKAAFIEMIKHGILIEFSAQIKNEDLGGSRIENIYKPGSKKIKNVIYHIRAKADFGKMMMWNNVRTKQLKGRV